MLRRPVRTVGIVLLSAVAAAQGDSSSRLRPITSPIREVAGAVDRATGRFVRTRASTDDGSTTGRFYNNTCPTGQYMPLRPASATGGSRAEAVVDQGLIPAVGWVGPPTCLSGTASVYEITEFQISYCTSTGSPVTYVANVWNNLGGTCPNNFGTQPSASITVTGLPRSPSAGVSMCYAVCIDLGTPGFAITGGVANDPPSRFAWSHEYPLTGGSDGPVVAGNPNPGGCSVCVGTVFENPTGSVHPGTGAGAQDAFWLEQFGGAGTSCQSFFGAPFASFYLGIGPKKGGGGPDLCISFCDAADGSHALCPGPLPNCVGGTALNPTGGCDIEFPPMPGTRQPGVQLDCIAQDQLSQSATMRGTGYPPTTMPLVAIIRGNNQEATPVQFGDGLRCVGLAGFVRFGETFATAGTSSHVFSHGAGPGTFYYQLWFRNGPTSYCDSTGGGPTYMGRFNFSNGRAITW